MPLPKRIKHTGPSPISGNIEHRPLLLIPCENNYEDKNFVPHETMKEPWKERNCKIQKSFQCWYWAMSDGIGGTTLILLNSILKYYSLNSIKPY